MTDRPIIFSGAMVRALLDGRKTQTRRLASSPSAKCQPGDRLWVREIFYCDHCDFPNAPVDEMRRLIEYRASHECRSWEAGCPCNDEGGRSSWRPSIHMPRWASRLTLVVTEVRRQRLQEISDDDVIAEGLEIWGGGEQGPDGVWHRLVASAIPGEEHIGGIAPEMYAELWDHLHGAGAWAENPEVVALSFRVKKINIDQLGKEAAR